METVVVTILRQYSKVINFLRAELFCNINSFLDLTLSGFRSGKIWAIDATPNTFSYCSLQPLFGTESTLIKYGHRLPIIEAKNGTTSVLLSMKKGIFQLLRGIRWTCSNRFWYQKITVLKMTRWIWETRGWGFREQSPTGSSARQRLTTGPELRYFSN